jgi:hypothetical protein
MKTERSYYPIRPWLATCDLYGTSGREGWVVVDCRALIDGAGNTVDQFAQLVKVGVYAHRCGLPVLVRCEAGRSRSNGVAMGILAIIDNLDFSDAVIDVKNHVPRADPNDWILTGVHQAVDKLRKGSL